MIFFNRSKLYTDGTLTADDEGLHGMVEKCGQKQLATGSHTLYLEGFQAGGGVGMELKYSGPDTGGKSMFVRGGALPSSSQGGGRYYSQCDPNSDESDPSQFNLCVFRSEVPLGQIPTIGLADTGLNRLYFVGKGKLPVVDIRSLDQFRMSVSGTPEFHYAWAIYGKLQVGTAGAYTLCIASDDGLLPLLSSAS